MQIARNAANLDVGDMFMRVFAQPDKQQLVITLNQQKQLFEEGVNSMNVIIGTYSPATEQMTGGEKRAGQHYTLLDTGAFYESFKIVSVTKESFTIDANGNKGDENLFEKYGQEILGLTDESKERLAKLITSEISFLTLQQILKG